MIVRASADARQASRGRCRAVEWRALKQPCRPAANLAGPREKLPQKAVRLAVLGVVKVEEEAVLKGTVD